MAKTIALLAEVMDALENNEVKRILHEELIAEVEKKLVDKGYRQVEAFDTMFWTKE